MAELVTNGTGYPPLPDRNPLAAVVENLDLRDLLIERGTTGLRQASGFIREDYLVELQGQQAIRKFREMKDTSGTVGSCLFAIEMLIRHVRWFHTPADESEEAEHYAKLADGMLFHDLDMPFDRLISEILSMLWAGFDYREMVFKRRLGEDPPPLADGTPQLPSLFNDGYVGFGKIAQRAQDTVLRWEFWPGTSTLRGMHQLDPWLGRHAYIPYEKSLLFRPSSLKDNPEGRSILRSAYRHYYLATHLENTEAVGAEREYTGFPLITVPPQWMTASATPEEVGQLEMVKRVGRNVKNDEQACIIFPAIFDPANNQLLKFEFVQSPGSRAFNIDPIIQRHELRIAQSMLADMIFLGHEQVGSFALASSKSTILSMAIAGILTAIADEFNRRALRLLWKLNAFPEPLRPTLQHGDVETVDLTELARFILSMGRVFNLQDLENHIRSLAGFPERPDAATHPLPPSILPAGGGEGFHAHGGGSGTGADVPGAVPGAGLPDLDRELAAPSI